jgi:glutathione S-transferase
MGARPSRLYDYPFSGNGYKIRLALHQLGIAVDYQIVDILKRETKTEAFLAKNPMGEIPALELSDGTVLRESNAILYWLTEGTPLMPTDKMGRTQVIHWMCFEQSNIARVLGRARFLKANPNFRHATTAEFDQWHAAGHWALGVMDQHLLQYPFLIGDGYSAADICLYGYVHTGREGGFELDRFPAVVAWLRRVATQPKHIPQSQIPNN